MYSIPLRRALVTNSDLPYPEGVACAEVLKCGGRGDAEDTQRGAATTRAGLLAIVVGSVASAGFAMVVATQLFASDVAQYFRVGQRNAATGYDFNLSFALFAVGHLVGLWVGVAMLVGAAIAWLGAVPYLTSVHPLAGAAGAVTHAVWSHQVRFIGAGTIGVAAIWTLIKLIRPVASGLHSAMLASRVRKAGLAETLPRTERDIPIGIVAGVTLACMLPIAWLLGSFSVASGLGAHAAILVAGGIIYIALMSFFVAAVCGYMAGLIGASNSPLSGVGILVVVGAGLLLVLCVKSSVSVAAGPALVAFALLVTAVVFAAATISNDNLQDLKTGQLVDATPWRQQVALIVGVAAGAAIIPPVLDLLNHAYGFAGAPGVDAARALAAPQAALISALAQGVIQGNLDWSLDRQRRAGGGGPHPARCGAQAHWSCAPAAAGGGSGHLSTYLHHADDRGRGRGGLVVRQACGSLRQSGRHPPTGRAAGLRNDRGRESGRGGACCRGGVFRPIRTTGAGRRCLCQRCHLGRRYRVCRFSR